MFSKRRHTTRDSLRATVRTEALEDLVHAIAVATDGPTLRALVTRRLTAVANARAAWFLEPTPDGHHLRATWPETDEAAPITVRADGPLATWLRINEAPLEFPGRTGISSYLAQDERTQLAAAGVGLCVPIFTVGRLRGVVLLASQERPWTPSVELSNFLMTCGRHAGLAFEAIERHEAVVDQVRTVAHAQRLAMAGQFAAMVAHEVRNPLAIIRGAVQLVRDTDFDPERRGQLLTDAIEEIDRISQTISGFLSLSRPPELHGSVIDVVEVVRDAVRIVETYATNRSITITTASEFPSIRVWGDQRELRQVFLNILLNASQAMQGAGAIAVGVTLTDEPQSDGSGHHTMVVIRITDNGPGIPPDLVDRIFEPFVSTKPTGTGLGLAICSQIAERHGGRLRVASEPGKGTTMGVYLPIRTD